VRSVRQAVREARPQDLPPGRINLRAGLSTTTGMAMSVSSSSSPRHVARPTAHPESVPIRPLRTAVSKASVLEELQLSPLAMQDQRVSLRVKGPSVEPSFVVPWAALEEQLKDPRAQAVLFKEIYIQVQQPDERKNLHNGQWWEVERLSTEKEFICVQEVDGARRRAKVHVNVFIYSLEPSPPELAIAFEPSPAEL